MKTPLKKITLNFDEAFNAENTLAKHYFVLNIHVSFFPSFIQVNCGRMDSEIIFMKMICYA